MGFHSGLSPASSTAGPVQPASMAGQHLAGGQEETFRAGSSTFRTGSSTLGAGNSTLELESLSFFRKAERVVLLTLVSVPETLRDGGLHLLLEEEGLWWGCTGVAGAYRVFDRHLSHFRYSHWPLIFLYPAATATRASAHPPAWCCGPSGFRLSLWSWTGRGSSPGPPPLHLCPTGQVPGMSGSWLPRIESEENVSSLP